MKKLTAFILISITATALSAQTGVNTGAPQSSSILEINSTNKGVLLPRLNIQSKANKSPVTATIADGLLAYNVSSLLPQSLMYWDTAVSSWNNMLYFKETPKVAVFGLLNDKNVLDNKSAGDYEFFGGATSPFYSISLGYMPGVSFEKMPDNDRWGFTVSEGAYTLEVSYLLSAPAANPSNRATILSANYYNMGYFCDLMIYPFNIATHQLSARVFSKRLEGSTISKINAKHRMNFIHTFEISGDGQSFLLVLDIGRRLSSSFNDEVKILADGTTFKLTKLK